MPFRLPLGGFCDPLMNSSGFDVDGEDGEQWVEAVGEDQHMQGQVVSNRTCKFRALK